MNKFLLLLVILVLFTGTLSAQMMNLNEVIINSARAVEEVMPQGAMVAVLNFASTSEVFSDYVIEELTGELVTGQRVTIVDRRNLMLITQEMNLHLSGDISDESAQAVGRMLGAQSIVSGTLTNMGTFHRFRIRVISVETAAIQTQVAFNLQNDAQVAFLLGGSPARVSPQPRRTQVGFDASNNWSVKFSLGGTVGFHLHDGAKYDWSNRNNRYIRYPESGIVINWLGPTFNLRFLYPLENRMHLGFGGNLTLSFFGILLSDEYGFEYPVVSGATIAPYAIIGYNNFSFHLGYDFAWGVLYFSPNFMINERLMVGIPVSLFRGNQFGLLALMNPPESRVSPPESYWDIRSNFQIGISIQYVF